MRGAGMGVKMREKEKKRVRLRMKPVGVGLRNEKGAVGRRRRLDQGGVRVWMRMPRKALEWRLVSREPQQTPAGATRVARVLPWTSPSSKAWVLGHCQPHLGRGEGCAEGAGSM